MMLISLELKQIFLSECFLLALSRFSQSFKQCTSKIKYKWKNYKFTFELQVANQVDEAEVIYRDVEKQGT